MPFFCIKNRLKRIIRLEWGDYMIFKLEYKKIIILLLIGFMAIMAFLLYKQEITNKIVPKRASYVRNIMELGENNG